MMTAPLTHPHLPGVSERERAFRVALLHLPGLGVGTLWQLLLAFDDSATIWQQSYTTLAQHAVLGGKHGLSEATWAERNTVWADAYDGLSPEDVLAQWRTCGIQVLCPEDPLFPPLLQTIHHPPPILYTQGKLTALQLPGVGIVGTRKATPYGERATEWILHHLEQAAQCTKQPGFSIVSGLAAGIDGFAHHGALKAGIPTVAVFGCGIDQVFPARHYGLAQAILDAGGCWVSEYPPGQKGDKHTFPRRNRIIAGLSEGVIVVEGERTSGALITARYAVEADRTVLAVPGEVFSPQSQGPLSLIAEGAVPLISTETLLAELPCLASPNRPTSKAPDPSVTAQTQLPVPHAITPARSAPPLDASESPNAKAIVATLCPLSQQVWTAITNTSHTLQSVSAAIQAPVATVSAVLTTMEILGLVCIGAGGRITTQV